MAKIERFEIRTSSRRVFRRCLRKWDYSSSLRKNLQRSGSESNINFWFGTGIHFAMEDYFGYNRFGDPRRAFKAYFDCFKPEDRPEGAEDHYTLGIAMLQYFLEWYPIHNRDMGFYTPWVDKDTRALVEPGTENAEPAVEQSFTLYLGKKVLIDSDTHEVIKEFKDTDVVLVDEDRHLENASYYAGTPIQPEEDIDADVTCRLIQNSCNAQYFDSPEVVFRTVKVVPVCYHGTMDRICIDRYGRWWVLDYKTAKGADTAKLDTDDQISAYLWAAEQVFNVKFYGFIYLQLTKDVAKPPKVLKNGDISTDKKQKTTHALYRQALIEKYGSVSQAPAKNIEALNNFADLEYPEGDRFIRWDFVPRNDNQKIATYNNIMGEVSLMCDSKLPIFPNPTRDCGWDCPFRGICIAEERGDISEAQSILDSTFEVRPTTVEHNREEWMDNLVYPENPDAIVDDEDIKITDQGLFNLILPQEYLEGGNE